MSSALTKGAAARTSLAACSPRWLVGLLHCTGEPGASPPMPMAPVGPRVTVCRGCLTGGSTGRATSARMPSTGAAAPLSMLCASSAALTACCARFCSYLWCGSIPYEALLNITVRAQRAGLWRLEAASMLACNSSGVVRPPGAGVHTASLFGPTYDRVFDGVVPPRTGAVSVINRVSCMCCEPGRAARLVHLAGASRVADGLDRCPGVPGGSKMDVFIRHARLYYTCRCQGTYLALSTTPLLAPGACDVATSRTKYCAA